MPVETGRAPSLQFSPAVTRCKCGSGVNLWTGEKLANTLRHIPNHPDYNPNFHQLLHVSFKVAAEYGAEYTNSLIKNKEIIGQQVLENILERHIKVLSLH